MKIEQLRSCNSSCGKCGESQMFNTYEQICYKCGHSEDDLILHEAPKKTMTQTFALFLDRHELPENLGAICEGFDFETFQVKKSPLWQKAVLCEDCEIYTTGLTPALTQFISEWVKQNLHIGQSEYSGETYVQENRLCLLHYNSKTKEYVRQVIFGRIFSNTDLQEMADMESREAFYNS